MPRYVPLLVGVGAVIGFVALAGNVSGAPPSTLAATTTITTEVTVVTRVPVETRPEDVVLAYWRTVGVGDTAAALALLDVPRPDWEAELGVVAYSGALGGNYQATCTEVSVVAEEVVVDCELSIVEQPLVELVMGDQRITTTQFRVRQGKITRIGHPEAFGVVDQALAAYASDVAPSRFAAVCTNGSGRYYRNNGVTYNAECGRFLATLQAGLITELTDAG